MSMAVPNVEGAWTGDLRHACPRCRSGIVLSEHGGTCPVCRFKVSAVDGIYNFLDPEAGIDDLQSTFDDLASGPERDTSAGVGYLSPLQQHNAIRAFQRLSPSVSAQTRILDVGCGNGLFWEMLLKRRQAVGVDFSLGMCRLARARGLITYQANALALPFADDQFDLLYCPETLQCIEDLAALFREFVRVCRPAAHIIVSSSDSASLIRWLLQAARKLKPNAVWKRNRPIIPRSAEEIVAAIRGLPLDLEMVCWTHFPLPWLRCRASTGNAFEWAASNVTLCFVKRV
jgi:SAM-dependent methyltransferase